MAQQFTRQPTQSPKLSSQPSSAGSTLACRVHRRIHLGVLALYTILTLLLTWPMPARLTTHVPGIAQWAFDESTFLWNVWYFKYALVDNLANPLHSELIWYPLGIDLILYTYNFFHALLAQPLMLAFNLPLASNVAIWLSTILSGYGVFLLVRYLLGRRWAGVSRLTPGAAMFAATGAGLLYAFGSNRAIYAMLGHYDMVTTQWIPFYALALLRALDGGLSRRRRIHAALWAGFFMALNGLAEMITAVFLAIFTLIVLLIVLPAGVRRGHQTEGKAGAPWPGWGMIVLLPLLAAATAFVVWSPVLLPILNQFVTDDFSLQGWGEAIPLSADLTNFFSPTVIHPIFGGDVVAELRRVQLRALEMGVTGPRDVTTVFLGWVTAALALIGLIRFRRRVKLWGWTALVFGLFSLGPFLQINGRYRFDLDGIEATFPLPFALLHYIPIVKANRAPNRNSVLLMLGLAVLVGYALAWLLQTRRGQAAVALVRRPQAWLAGAFCAAILFEHLAVPLPLSDARVPAVYDQIAADPRPVSVMHVPLGWRNSFGVFGAERTQLQYYQHVHRKPMLGGNISRAPDFKMDYFKRIPYFQVMEAIQFGREVDPALVEQAQAQVDELVYLYNTGYVLLMPPIPQRFPYADHWEAAWDFAQATLPLEDEPFWTGDGIEAYRVVQPAGSDAFTLDLGEPGTYPYRAEGWDTAEADRVYDSTAIWATGPSSRALLPLRNVDPATTYQVRVQVHPFAYPGSPEQLVTLRVNGQQLPSQALVNEWQTLTWEIPGTALVSGINRLELIWGWRAAPRDVLGGDRAIGSTGVQLPIDADLKAFAEGGFMALFDETGTQTDASAGRLGVNVTVLDPTTGAVVDSVGFDTTANQYESEALAAYLNTVEPGQIVLVASYGPAWANLGEDAVAALQGIGAAVERDQLQEQYFAIIGVQGAAPGSAAQAVDPNEAFLSISLNRDRRTLAAAVDWIEIVPSTEQE